MALRRKQAAVNVVEAAEQRLINIFRNGLKVYAAFSGGKDSLCLAQLLINLLRRGKINPAQLAVYFIDEEAIFPCVERTVMDWRKKFMLLGVRFEWYCLEVRHYNCFNNLTSDESFICWDSEKKSAWVRQPPTFAIREHKRLKPYKDTYQDFCHRLHADGISITGVRVAESVQRLYCLAASHGRGNGISKSGMMYPIYDWKNEDVWLYLREQRVTIPEIYLYLWQVGCRKNQLRVSQFFSNDTAGVLVRMNEYYPDLMERVIRREPNAYLAALYWDSEMFGRSTATRRRMESGEPERDYKTELIKLFSDIPGSFPSPHHRQIAEDYKKFFLRVHKIAGPKSFKRMYEGLISGDPKKRTLRALFTHVFGEYAREEYLKK